MRNKILLIKIALVFSVIIISLLSSNNFINNDNYFPISYLFMLEHEDFFNSLVNFIPIQLPSFFLEILFYCFITPLSSTYAPLPYIIYPITLLFNSASNTLIFTLLLNTAINSWILIEAFNRFKKANKQNVFLVSLFVAGFGIGNLIYIGSNMPYSFIVSAVFLMVGMSIDDNDNLPRDIWIIIFLFLLNYQVLFLIPTFFIIKSVIFIKSKKRITKPIVIAILALGTVVMSSILFITAREKLTGTHSNVGVNWNSGVNNEFVYDQKQNLLVEVIDLLTYLPKSIIYHFNEQLYSFNFFPIIFWCLALLIAIKGIISKKLNYINAFFFTSLFTLIILVFLGKASYGPTRHSLYLLPLFCLLTFNILKLKLVETYTIIIITCFFSYQNFKTIYDRKNDFFYEIKNIYKIIDTKPNHDILLFSCTYQPFLEKTFRESIENKKIHFFCGSRLQKINKNIPQKDSLLIIDATGQNRMEIAQEINKRISSKELYSSKEIKLFKEFFRLNHNMEQKDYTQLPKKTGLFIWESTNKLN